MLEVAVGSYLAGLVIYGAARLLIGDRHWIAALLNNTVLYILPPLLVCLPIALILKSVPLIVGSSSLLIFTAIWLSPYLIPKPTRTSTGLTLRVITFNMWGGNPHQKKVTAWLLREDADIVFLQEVPESYAAAGFAALKDCYPHQYRLQTPQLFWSNAVLSKYPILSITDLDSQSEYASTRQRLEIDVLGQKLALYSIHLTYTMRLPRVPTTWSLLNAVVRYDDSQRSREIDCLLAELAGEKHPYIVAGDFNMSAQAVTYRKLASQMHDAFREVGHGMGGTWPLSGAMNFPFFILPLMRIDYVWHSDHMRALRAEIGIDLGSDHLPVNVLLELCP